MTAPGYRPMTARGGDAIPLRRIHQCIELFTSEGPWSMWISLEALSFWRYLARVNTDRNPQRLDMLKDWPDWDHALVAAVPLIGDLAVLSDVLGDDGRVRRLLIDLARLDGPALSTLADRLHERVASRRRQSESAGSAA